MKIEYTFLFALICGFLALCFSNSTFAQNVPDAWQIESGSGWGIFGEVTDAQSSQNQAQLPTFYASAKKSFKIEETSHVVSFGPAFYYQQVKSSGDVWLYGAPVFNNHNYALQNRNMYFMMEGQLSPFRAQTLSAFYLMAGTGMNVNTGQVNQMSVFQTNGNGLSQSLDVNLAVNAGLGLQLPLIKQTNMELNMDMRYIYIRTFGQPQTTQNSSPLTPVQFGNENHNFLAGINYNF